MAAHIKTLNTIGAHGRSMYTAQLSAPFLVNEPQIATFFQIIVVTHGNGVIQHLEPIAFQSGDIHVLPTGVQHHVLQHEQVQGWLIAFDPKFLKHMEPLLQENSTTAAVPSQSLFVRGLLRLQPDATRWQRLLHLIEAIHVELDPHQWGGMAASESLLNLLLIELFREHREHAPQLSGMLSNTVLRALAYIEQHCLQPLSLQDVATAFNCTPSHMAHIMREQTGMTVGDWVREHRLVEARKLLLTGNTVEATALTVGYTDVTHFIRVFRKAHQTTPKAWQLGVRSSTI